MDNAEHAHYPDMALLVRRLAQWCRRVRSDLVASPTVTTSARLLDVK